ncbi:Ig-like domain-containing protein [Fredinandcohnia sp. 179-A 10B2 NHS]|uniref:Ig-like domain-containing protein n=1 Tax=Fredinandcohnia sp. 179-A 10B2 NHS TaxID=3235176 RepID=UPI0039A1E3EE
MISRSYRKNKTVFWIPAVLLVVLSVALFSGNVFSEGDIERKVIFNNDEWDISEDFTKEWLSNQDQITFKVDLTEDYQNYLESIKVPEEPQEEELSNPGGDGSEPENPVDGTENSTPGEEPAPPVVGIPFSATTEIGTTSIKEVETDGAFQGLYEVTVTVPAETEDLVIPIHIDFANNDWNIPNDVAASFSIERDTSAPGISFTGVGEDNPIEYKDVAIKISISDENYNPANVNVTVKKDEIDFVIEDELDWSSGEETITFKQAGDYVVTVTATDKAGNVTNPPATRLFSIYKKEAEFNIKNKTSNGFYNGNVEIEVINDIRMSNFEATIEKDGIPITVTPNFSIGGRKATLKLQDEGAYQIKVSFNDRRQQEKYVLGPHTLTIDKTKPVVTIAGVTEGNKYKESKEISFNLTEKNEDTTKRLLTVKRNGTKYLEVKGVEAFSNRTFTEDGSYEIDVTSIDLAGNEDDFKPVTFTIDTTAPELAITGVENNGYYKTDREVVMTAFDELTLNETKINAVIEKVGDSEFKADVTFSKKSGTTAEAKYSFKNDGEYRITLNSTDDAGNTATEKTVTFTMDKTKPVINVTGVENNSRYAEDKNVQIDVSDINLEDADVAVLKNGKEYTIDPLEVKDGAATTSHLFTADGVYQLQISAKDKAGNQHSSTIQFTIDKSVPEILYSIVNGTYFNENQVNLTVSVEDYTPFLPEITVIRKHNGETTEIPTGEWADEVVWLFTQRKTINLVDEGEYFVTVTATDYFGKESTKELAFTIDRTLPEISVAGIPNKGFVQKNNQLTINIDDLHFNSDLLEVKVNGKVVEDANWEETEAGYLFTQTFEKDGEYEVIVNAEDFAGNKANEKQHTFTVDNIAPVIKIDGVKNGTYYDKKQKATIKVNELNYKNNKVTISVTRNGGSYPFNEWKNQDVESSLEIPFNDDGDYVVTVAATDAADNSGEKQVVAFTVDETYPELEIKGVEHDFNYKVNKEVEFIVRDTNIDTTSLRVTKNGKDYQVGSFTKSGSVASLTHTFKEEGEYVLNFESTDKSGNKTKHNQILFIIDKTNPVVKIDGVDHQSFNPTGKRVTVSVDELNFTTNEVELTATKDGATFNIGAWKNSSKLSSLSYNFNDDGLYTVGIRATDKAGNGPISASKTFTIDTTKPAIEITGVENAQHYNIDKPVNVAIRDVNLDVNRITVTRDGRGYNAGAFSVSNNTARLSHNFSQEGDYVIQVAAIDKAGNEYSQQIAFTIDKTDPVITPKFRGQSRVITDGEYINEVFTPEFALAESEDTIVSVTLNGSNVTGRVPTASQEITYNYNVVARDKAGNESTLQISFIVDTTRPSLTISGILDGFFNKNQAPTVNFSDRYLDRERSYVTLNGRPFENGITLEDEGDYTLKAEIFDLANNVSARTIIFTIDKTSPVIKFSEPISNEYFNKTIMPELLIEDMSAYDIISLTLNGQPYNLGDPIEEEGKHVLFFEVKDKAGNIQQLSVEFIIDKTAPAVVYEGVKAGETYHDPVTVSIKLDNPTDDLKSVTINGELFEADVTNEDGNQVITTTLSEINTYKIEVHATDVAGNEHTEEISFEIVEKSVLVKFYENKTLFAGTIVGLAGAAAAGAVALRRSIIRRRDAKNV